MTILGEGNFHVGFLPRRIIRALLLKDGGEWILVATYNFCLKKRKSTWGNKKL